MAKISELKYELNGQQYKTPVNVGSDGMFKANVPAEIREKLNLRNEIRFSKLSELEAEFYGAIKRFKEAATVHEIFIAIRYGASYKFSNGANGYPLWGGYGHKYTVEINHNEWVSGLVFDFKVVVKETIDGVITWYETEERGNVITQDQRKAYGIDKWTKIPYNEVQLQTLKTAHENIRKLSEMLYKFIEQDEEQMKLTLSGGKLLLAK